MATEVEKTTVTTVVTTITTEETREEQAAVIAVTNESTPAVEAEKEVAAVVETVEAKEAAPAKEPAPKKPTVHKVNFEKDVVYLYQFARTPSLPSLSPYVLKVETWLRLVGLKYEVSH